MSGTTIARYLDLLVNLLLVRRLLPNAGKRLVRSSKVYVRDSGLLHALLGLPSKEALLGHPVVGGSWEGFVVENLLAAAGPRARPSFYRSAHGAEIDLVLGLPSGETWAVEVKRSPAPSVERGLHSALADLEPERAFVVYPGTERWRLAASVEAVGLVELCGEVRENTDPTLWLSAPADADVKR